MQAAHSKGIRRGLWGAGRVLSQGGDAGHTGVFPTPPSPHCTSFTCTLPPGSPLPSPHPLPAHAPLPGSPHPQTLRTTPGHWKTGVNGHAGGMRTASLTPRHCQLQAPAASLRDTAHMRPSKGLPHRLSPPGLRGMRVGRAQACGCGLGLPWSSLHNQPALPCVILADTISVICEVSFFRNSSVPTSAKDRWLRASAARRGGQSLAQPAVCSTDVPEHLPLGPSWAWDQRCPWTHRAGPALPEAGNIDHD